MAERKENVFTAERKSPLAFSRRMAQDKGESAVHKVKIADEWKLSTGEKVCLAITTGCLLITAVMAAPYLIVGVTTAGEAIVAKAALGVSLVGFVSMLCSRLFGRNRNPEAAARKAIKEGRTKPFEGIGDSYGLKPLDK